MTALVYYDTVTQAVSRYVRDPCGKNVRTHAAVFTYRGMDPALTFTEFLVCPPDDLRVNPEPGNMNRDRQLALCE